MSNELTCDAEDEGTNYRGLALQICDDLHDDDIEALKFISRDFLSVGKLERIKTAHNLLESWEKFGKFGKEKPWFLAECLLKLQRLDLLEDLGINEDELETRLHQDQSQISDYRKLLLKIAEDLDSEELHKMLYLVGSMKKKDREKVQSPMSFLSYLEQTKMIAEDNLCKLRDILHAIDRNDLIDPICKYEASKGLIPPGVQMNMEENMDTSDSGTQLPQVPPTQTAANKKRSHHVVAEHPHPQAPASVVNQLPLGIHCEERTGGLQVERSRDVPVHLPKPEEVTQSVIVQPLLLEIAHELARTVDDNTWKVFGCQLKLPPETIQQVGRCYPDMKERMYNLLIVWLNTWQEGHNEAMAAIVVALHEVRMHDLAERFSKMYRPLGNSELQETSLSGRSMSSSVEHGNISVNTSEARYREPEESPPPAAVGEAVATASPFVQQQDSTMPCYRMDRRPRGLCIIINNEKFFKHPEDSGAREMPNREGTQRDAERLLQTFTELYFEVRLHDNLESTEMVRVLVDAAYNNDHTQYDCFVCCILSHGTQGYIYGTEGRLVNINDLTTPFKSVMCPSLAGKPKLFFIQACQGREKQPGQEIERDGTVEIDGIPKEVIPNESDFLIGYATVPGFVSYRSRSHGSWYITKLCEQLNKYATRYDLLSILVLVNNEVGRANANLEGGRFKQSPAPLYTLRKKLMFT